MSFAFTDKNSCKNNVMYYLEISIHLSKQPLFPSRLWPFLNQALFLEAAGVVIEIGSSLKLNPHQDI